MQAYTQAFHLPEVVAKQVDEGLRAVATEGCVSGQCEGQLVAGGRTVAAATTATAAAGKRGVCQRRSRRTSSRRSSTRGWPVPRCLQRIRQCVGRRGANGSESRLRGLVRGDECVRHDARHGGTQLAQASEPLYDAHGPPLGLGHPSGLHGVVQPCIH